MSQNGAAIVRAVASSFGRKQLPRKLRASSVGYNLWCEYNQVLNEDSRRTILDASLCARTMEGASASKLLLLRQRTFAFFLALDAGTTWFQPDASLCNSYFPSISTVLGRGQVAVVAQ